ncbi:DUF808 domain-containing protein [Rubripirellula reticaptiva]|uniref:Inner membrane protein YedI n=1 Tax=Rubripirellula reticaptiva TaxID=2528013 RepID=A0A5C6EXG7_9BACT|nr:DUF808 domain-containing protein [Rubripirellula reticaptiva]TWU51911.1 Inner membrane protein YedI [Rubripirellula reticaptiva]
MASGLLLLLDDITTILDDVSILTKVAAKKTAGVLGDDLALNAQQVSGVDASRELPVVWAVAKGSLLNKVILVPSALTLSAIAPWSIDPLLIAGGAYLCFEGCEKLAHAFFHDPEDEKHAREHESLIADNSVDIVAAEKTKIAGAIRTDFILSAEIVVITLGTVATEPFMTRVAVLVAISLLMTVGVYGLVAGIVKLDDLGRHLILTSPAKPASSLRRSIGTSILTLAPYLMKFLSLAGTVAMFLVGGGLLAHGIAPIHHFIESVEHRVAAIEPIGGFLASISTMVLNGIIGVLIGAIVLAVVLLAKKIFAKPASQA